LIPNPPNDLLVLAADMSTHIFLFVLARGIIARQRKSKYIFCFVDFNSLNASMLV
jgi:hypothetical protein